MGVRRADVLGARRQVSAGADDLYSYADRRLVGCFVVGLRVHFTQEKRLGGMRP